MEYATRPHRRLSGESLVDEARIVDIATRYPHIETTALAERFGCSVRNVLRVLNSVGIHRTVPPAISLKTIDPHPWRPTSIRRRPTGVSMTAAEKKALVDDFMRTRAVTKVPRGAMTTGHVIFIDQTRND